MCYVAACACIQKYLFCLKEKAGPDRAKTRPHMSMSRCGYICIRRGFSNAVVLMQPCQGDTCVSVCVCAGNSVTSQRSVQLIRNHLYHGLCVCVCVCV